MRHELSATITGAPNDQFIEMLKVYANSVFFKTAAAKFVSTDVVWL